MKEQHKNMSEPMCSQSLEKRDLRWRFDIRFTSRENVEGVDYLGDAQRLYSTSINTTGKWLHIDDKNLRTSE